MGKAVGRRWSGTLKLERFSGLEGIKTHKTIARTTRSNPTGSLNAPKRVRGGFRRVKIRRLYIGLINFTSD